MSGCAHQLICLGVTVLTQVSVHTNIIIYLLICGGVRTPQTYLNNSIVAWLWFVDHSLQCSLLEGKFITWEVYELFWGWAHVSSSLHQGSFSSFTHPVIWLRCLVTTEARVLQQMVDVWPGKICWDCLQAFHPTHIFSKKACCATQQHVEIIIRCDEGTS